MMTLIRGYALSKDATVQGTIGICAAGVASLPRAKSTTRAARRESAALTKDATVLNNTNSGAIGMAVARNVTLSIKEAVGMQHLHAQ